MKTLFLILCGCAAFGEGILLTVGYLRALKGKEPLSRFGLRNGVLIGLFFVFWVIWNEFR